MALIDLGGDPNSAALWVVLLEVGGFVLMVAIFVSAWREMRAKKAGEDHRRTSPPHGIGDALRAHYAAGRWNELVRLLDDALPEAPVAASLIEAARGIAGLQADIARSRLAGVSDELTRRLEVESGSAASAMWDLAERLAAAERIGATRLQAELAREDETLDRLRKAIGEARDGLAELTLADAATWSELRRAEVRFRAPAAAARDLRDFEREGY